MNLEFLKIIETIETEIESKYLPGAIKWADDNHNNAWTKAISRFENAMLVYGNGLHPELVKLEGKVYLETVKDLIVKFKDHKANLNLNLFDQPQ